MKKLTSSEMPAVPLVLALPSALDAGTKSSASPAGAKSSASPAVPLLVSPPPPPPPAGIRPSEQMKERSPDRFAVTFTADRALHDKIERLKALMAHTNPTGDIAVVVARAVDLLLEKIEKERLGKTARPRASRESTDPGYISNETKRIVVARDGDRCSFVRENGERCTECKFLEFDHVIPRACGGAGDPSNIRLLCRAHNRYAAERAFGREHVEQKIHQRQQRSAAKALDSAAIAPIGPTEMGPSTPVGSESSPSPNVALATSRAPTASIAWESAASPRVAPPTAAAQVHYALVSIGFRSSEAHRAVAAIQPEGGRPVVELLREAIALLTPRPSPRS